MTSTRTSKGMLTQPVLLAGYPDRYPTVYHRIRVPLGDMTVVLDFGDDDRTIFVRNIEVPRVKRAGTAREVLCPEDCPPASGLDANRNVMFAQATAEYLRRRGVRSVVSDQLLPLLFVDVLSVAGIAVECDRSLGVLDRRQKDEWEIEQLADAQSATEDAIHHAFEVLRDADVSDGVLIHENEPLTSERLRSMIAIYLLERGFASPGDCIAAGGADGADCHNSGAGALRINEPIILDVYPIGMESKYSGDCTRTLCRGEIRPELREIHEVVIEAKKAAIDKCRPGTTGAEVHEAACAVFRARGYHIGMPGDDAPKDLIYYPHGTGHGIGLETHEPPLLDEKNHEPLVVGDALTVEPGLYCKAFGGVRIEDLVIVSDVGPARNLNTRLPETLWWE